MKKKKQYDTVANVRNTPHLRENLLVICLSYGFLGLNFFLTGVRITFEKEKAILLGIVFLILSVVCIFDRRREMCSAFNAVTCCMIHFFGTFFAASYFSYWWLMGVYAGEVACIGIAVWISVKRLPKKGRERKRLEKRKKGGKM